MITVKQLCRMYLEPGDNLVIDNVNDEKTIWEGSIGQGVNCEYSDYEVESFSSVTDGICVNISKED